MHFYPRHPPGDSSSSTTLPSSQWDSGTTTSTDGNSWYPTTTSSMSFTSPTPLTDAPPSPSPESTPSPSTLSSESLQVTSAASSATTLAQFLSVTTSRDEFITSTSPSSTSLINTASDSSSVSSLPIALIAGLSIGLFILILLIVAGILAYRRHKRGKYQLNETTRDMPSRRANDGFVPVADEDDLEDNARLMRNVRMIGPGPSMYRSSSPAPSMLRSRVSETGSIFREEVWPPPGPSSVFVDPIEMSSSQVDLSTVVDEVMGPSESIANHRRQLTDTTIISSVPLLVEHHRDDAALSEDGSSPSESRSSSPSPTLPHRLPLGAPPLVIPRHNHLRHMSSSTSSSAYSAVSSISTHSPPVIVAPPVSYRPPSYAGSTASSIPRTQPKVSSPLVRALTGFGVGK